MIVSRALKSFGNSKTVTQTLPEVVGNFGSRTVSGQIVNPETSRYIASAFRCGNIISDDVAKMPLQQFVKRSSKQIEQVQPDSRTLNLAYLLEVSPNQWGWTPFLFKKAVIQWLLYWGNAFIWTPPVWPRQMLILPADTTYPVFDNSGALWYHVIFDGKADYLPAVEVLHLLINPDTTGFEGRSVITYASESLGRQLGAYDTQSRFYSQGLSAAGILWTAGEVDAAARKKIREQYESAMSGSTNAYRIAVMDPKITKFEQITMKPVDMQFLESIQATDVDIANFFGLPLYKLNMGKQSYQSNEQQNLDYLSTTLDPYLVQWEQAARIKWISEAEQNYSYFKFIREALLRTDSKTRADYLSTKIQSGQMTPNEARAIEDQSGYAEGDTYWMPGNILKIGGNNTP
jgi:HK97 family phage portal protein